MIACVLIPCTLYAQSSSYTQSSTATTPAQSSAQAQPTVTSSAPANPQQQAAAASPMTTTVVSPIVQQSASASPAYAIVTDPEFQELDLRSRELDFRSKELDFRAKEITFRSKENYLRGLLSAEGKLLYDIEQNSLMVVDYPENIKRLEEYLDEIDIPMNQVLIEARIVEVSLEGEHAMGVNWSLFGDKRGIPLGQYSLYSTEPAAGLEHKHQGLAQAIAYKNTYYPPNQTTTGSEEPFTMTLFDENISIVVKALSNRLKTTVLSAPSITTVNNRKADIKVISQLRWVVPTISVSDAGTTTLSWAEGGGSPQEVGIVLDVVPRITDDGQVAMELHPEISEQTDSLSLRAIAGATTIDYTIPIISKRTANTKVVIGDGQTLIIGGLIKNNATKGETKVPLLGDMPILGHMFRSKKDTKLKTELLIFVSPKIITPKDYRSMKAAREKISKDTIGRSVFNIETQKPVIDSIFAGDNIKKVVKEQEEAEALENTSHAAVPQSKAAGRVSSSIPPYNPADRHATSVGRYPSVTEPLQKGQIAVIVNGEDERERDVKRLLNLFDN